MKCKSTEYAYNRYIFNCLIIAGILFFIILPVSVSYPQDVTDDEIKAALMFKFPVYIKWPKDKLDDEQENFKCCVFGDGILFRILKHFNGQEVLDRKLKIVKVSDISQARDCHMLFVGNSQSDKISNIINFANEYNILTIGDTMGMAKKGVAVNFVLKNGSVHFEINPEAGKRAGLKISSKLLRLANIVGND